MRWMLVPITIMSVAAFFILYSIQIIIPNERNTVESNFENLQNYTLPLKSYQFYSEMRFPNDSISYEISPDCSNIRRDDTEAAFIDLQEETILRFYESSNGEIKVLCSEIAPEPEKKGHFIAGEGGPIEIVNATKFSIIKEARVSLYREESCNKPLVAIHEILHALGFDHNNKSSTLYPVTDCKQKIDNYIIKEINRLYSIQSLPDLSIEKINAKKKAGYLDFEMIISNDGLIDSGASQLSIYNGERIYKKVVLSDGPVGTKKMLNVTNLKIDRNIESVTFEIDGGTELDYTNNKAIVQFNN